MAPRVIIDLPNEEWLPVVGYEGLYEVSNMGRALSVERLVAVNDPRRGYGAVSAKILNIPVNSRGYGHVKLARNGKQRHLRIHRLVLAAFIGPCPEGHEGCHIDGDPTNNQLDNLYWGTKQQNMRDKLLHGNNPNANKTHCKWGHEYTPENTYLHPSKPGRRCHTCRRIRARREAAA